MRIPINEIQAGKRLHGLREPAVAELMASISKIGLLTPISVKNFIVKRPGNSDGVAFDLVAGLHRWEACKRLGWAEIEASVIPLSEDEAILWEVDENLCRAELSELERAEHLAKRKEVYERLHPETRASSGAELAQKRWGYATDNLSAASGFAADTAEKIGVSDRDVRRSIRRVEKIDEKVRDRIRDNPEIAEQPGPWTNGLDWRAPASRCSTSRSRISVRHDRAHIAALSGRGRGAHRCRDRSRPSPPVGCCTDRRGQDGDRREPYERRC